jgi:excisionase family DNA binding protein
MDGQGLADLPPVITVKEMAQLLRLSRSAAYRRIEAGQIEAFKLARVSWLAAGLAGGGA